MRDDGIVVPGADQSFPEVMGDVQPLQPRLDVVRQPFIGEMRVDPDGVPPTSGRVTARSTAPQVGTSRQLVSL
jgi:hypothetical protein|nr:hypothetical protein [Sphingobium fuliginis]